MVKSLISVAVLVVTVALVGCGNRGSTSSRPGQVTLTLSGWESNLTEKQRLQSVIEQFEAQNPDIDVKYEVIGDQYMDVIQTRLIGGQGPDVFYLDGFEAPQLMTRNVLEPLDSYLTDDFDIKDFDPLLLQVFQTQGQTYGLPKDFSTLALYYNKQAFQAAGLTTPPKTWTEFRDYAKKLTIDRDGDGQPEQYGFGLAPELARQAFMMRAYGGKLVDDRSKAAFATTAGLQGLQQVVEQYQQDQSAVQPSDVGTSSGSEMFGQGKVAMVIEGPWAIPYLRETFPELEFATAEVPQVNNQPGTMVYTVAYVINQRSEHKAAAWKLVAFLTGKPGMQAWTQGGLALPARQSLVQALQGQADPLLAPFLAGVDYAMPWQAGPHLPIIRDHFNNQFLSALLGQQPLAEAMQQAQQTANQEITATRSP